MVTWKVWSDQKLVFEGDENKAREYLVEHVGDSSALVLESPDGDLYYYEDDCWMPEGTLAFWGQNGPHRWNGASSGPYSL